MQEGQNRGTVRILHNLAGLTLHRTVQDRKRVFFCVQNIRKKPLHPLPCFPVDAAANPPEIANGAHIVPTRHDPFEGM
jgi:hypothetical protein